jgi:hypothetical protein
MTKMLITRAQREDCAKGARRSRTARRLRSLTARAGRVGASALWGVPAAAKRRGNAVRGCRRFAENKNRIPPSQNCEIDQLLSVTRMDWITGGILYEICRISIHSRVTQGSDQRFCVTLGVKNLLTKLPGDPKLGNKVSTPPAR